MSGWQEYYKHNDGNKMIGLPPWPADDDHDKLLMIMLH